MKSYLLIALFGAFGTLARYSVIQITPKIFQTIFPIGTLTVNLLGCFLIGLVSGVLDTKFISIDENFIKAKKKGVKFLCYSSKVTDKEIILNKKIEIKY